MFKEEITQHCPLCEEWAEKYKELDEKFTEVLNLSKENADANEFCIEGLEEIIEKYRHVISEIKKISETILWKYPNLDDVTKYNTFDKILEKTKEVLNEQI